MLTSTSSVEGGLIRRLCLEKLEQQFQELRVGALQPMGTFMDYLTYGYMIDNVCLLISGQLNGRDPEEQFASLNPLGKFPTISAVSVADGPQALYDYVLCQTPLGPYFKTVFPYVDMQINHVPPPFGETNIEIIRESLYKAYYEDFYGFCQRLGGITAEVMCDLLEVGLVQFVV
jgi:V-type H+-transporting ATPase subunit d